MITLFILLCIAVLVLVGFAFFGIAILDPLIAILVIYGIYKLIKAFTGKKKS